MKTQQIEKLPKFDPNNHDHLVAMGIFWDTQVWPENMDIQDRHTDPVWVTTIAIKTAEVLVRQAQDRERRKSLLRSSNAGNDTKHRRRLARFTEYYKDGRDL